jgi:hypothetical protein
MLTPSLLVLACTAPEPVVQALASTPLELPEGVEVLGDAPAGGDPDALFARLDVPELRIELSPEQWRWLEKQPREWVPANFIVDEMGFDVGMRLKGNSTFQSIWGKPTIKLDFDRDGVGQRLWGLEHLELHNLTWDPSYIHERLAYGIIAESGFPAPQTAYVHLWLNDMDYGLYLAVETMDDIFVEEHWDDPSGPIYEGPRLPGYCDLKTPDAFGEVCHCFQQDQEGDDPDREHLKDLCLAARGATEETWWADMSEHVDLEDFLRSVATEAVIQHFDGYAGNDNNFRLYREPATGLWTWTAWSTDQAFGWVPWQGTFDCGMARAEPKDFFWQSDMMRACWDAPDCKERFYELVGEQVEVFEALDVASWMHAERERIAPLAEADPKLRFQPADQRAYTECLLGWAEQRGPWLEEWLQSDERW